MSTMDAFYRTINGGQQEDGTQGWMSSTYGKMFKFLLIIIIVIVIIFVSFHIADYFGWFKKKEEYGEDEIVDNIRKKYIEDNKRVIDNFTNYGGLTTGNSSIEAIKYKLEHPEDN